MLEHTYTFWVSSLKSSHADRYRPSHPRTGIMNIAKALVGRLWKVLTIETVLPVLLLCVEPQNLKRAEARHCRLLSLRNTMLASWSGVYASGEHPIWVLSEVFPELSNFMIRKWVLGRWRLRVGGRRHEVLSHSFLTAVWGHYDIKKQREHLSLLAAPLLTVVSQCREATWCLVTEGRTQRRAESVFRLLFLACHVPASVNNWVQMGLGIGANFSTHWGPREWQKWKCRCLSPYRISCTVSWGVKTHTLLLVALLFVIKRLLATQSLLDLTVAIGFPHDGFY